MTCIYLYVRKPYTYRAGRCVSITVSEDTDYQFSKLFIKRIHTLIQPKSECIYVFKSGWNLTKYLTLTPNGLYSSANLTCVDVYFNKYENKTPLLFVLHFQNGDGTHNGVQNRYYPRSKFEGEMASCTTKSIDDLCQYNNDESILCDLLQENDRLDQVLTYDIMQRPTGYGDGKCTYNCDKINVTKNGDGQPKLTPNGFTRFKHTPKNGGHKSKPACIVYNCQALLKDGGDELEGVQGQQYQSVTVYFGGRAKRPCTQNGAGVKTCTKGQGSKCPPGQASAGSTCTPGQASPGQTCTAAPEPDSGTTQCQDVPLLLELVNNGDSNNTDYYVHRRKKNNGETGSNDQYYWVKLTLQNRDNGQNGLKELLNDIGMPEALSGGNGASVQTRLAQTATGASGQTTYLELLLKRLEFDLTDSVVILLDKKNGSEGYDDEIQTAISTLQPTENSKWINPLKLGNGHKIGVTDSNGTNTCLKNHKYRVVEHSFENAVKELGDKCSAGLRFLMPTRDGNGVDSGGNGTNYRELKLYSSDTQTEAQHLEYLYYTGGSNGGQNGTKVYVVFYAGTGGDGAGTGDSDPRPLLLCYQGQTYKPKDKTGYDSQQWVKVDGLNKCLCQNGSDTANGPDDKLLGAVTGVVGFLNTVNLSQHPNGTSKESESQACQAGTAGESSTATTCQPGTTGTNTCTYPVHKFQGKSIQVKVTCEPVPSTPGSNGSPTCYRKLTHTPAGMSGTHNANGSGFRLGDVEYCPNGTRRQGTIDYYGATNGNGLTADTKNRWAPLKSVWAYFYDQDTKYSDPLLVVLEFNNGSTGTEKECYKLTNASGSLKWENDTVAAKTAVDANDGKLVAHLDAIRYCLKKVVRIRLECKTGDGYSLMGRDANSPSGSTGTFTPINGAGTQVEVKVVPCPALTGSNYKCFKHELTTALENHHHEVAGLAFTLPGESGSVIEIPLDPNEGKGAQVTCSTSLTTGQSGSKITYNKCMGDVCVYFYHPASGPVQPLTTDTVPLMLQYNGRFYRPCDRDNYFDKWVCVTDLATLPGDCGCSVSGSGGHEGCEKLASELDRVNRALNRIDLDPEKASGQGYGLPENGQSGGGTGYKLEETVGNVRVKVTKQQPTDSDASQAYERVVHRTKNGFLIGDITYGGQEIVAHGVKVNGAQNSGLGATIRIANGGTGHNHKAHVNTYHWNTVAVYYSVTDREHKLPQLIVILKTDDPVTNGDTVTGSTGIAYGYYVLATQSGVGGVSGGSGTRLEYKWFEVKETHTTGVELNDETDFLLLNSGVILLEQRDKGTGGSGSYGEGEISAAVTSAIRNGSLKESPGRSGQVNRLKGRKITVTEEPTTHQCLNDTGFKVVAHDITNLVDLSGKLKEKLSGVTLITGLKFLIPTPDGGGKYKQVKLKDNGATDASIKYHQKGQNKIYVFFYGSDPRPLLLCYNGWAYRPKSMTEYDEQKWTKVTGLDKCDCTKQPPGTCDKCPLVSALVRVSDFLNPVDIKKVPDSKSIYSRFCRCYHVHKFNGRKIWIRVSAQPACGSFCFDRFTHSHAGIYGEGKGFRLGDIWYDGSCIKETQNGGNNGKCINSVLDNGKSSPKCETASHVVVFYYKKDPDRNNPIVVAMCSGECNKLECKLYYILKDRAGKKYKKGSGTLTMDDPKKLGDQLDAALFTNSKHLRVVLAARPEPRDYKADQNSDCKAEPVENNGQDEGWYKQQVKKLAGFRSCNVKTLEHIAEKAKRDATRKPADVELLQASLLHHVLRETSYKAQLLNGQPPTPPGSPPTLSITVTEVNCHKSYTNAGYRCFQHLLMSAENIEDVGGLKLAVFDGPGKQEIALCTGDKTAKNGKIDQITYTTCKGDLYVFFYGEDPRPLLLCYDGHAYRPTSMAGYCKTWVKVDGETVGTGELDIPFRADPKVLKALYDVSRFMNPVKLCLGQGAYQKLDPQHGQQQQSEQSEGPKPAKQEWTYTIDTNPKPPVCVRVTGIDLRCYKQYVHRPAIDGYRLGKVTYVEAKGGASVQPGTCTASQTGPGGPSLTCPQGAAGPGAPAGTPYCFEYDSSRQLWSVCVYYYMYDKDHNWPLVVELGFRGQSSEFFRLCCAGDNGAGSTAGNGVNGANGECKAPKGLRWVKMAHTTQKTGSPIANNSCKNGAASSTSSQNGQTSNPSDLCQPCNTDTDSQSEDSKKTCKKDAEFVKRAREIHNAIYETDRHDSLFLGDRVPLESDLNDLIERRALEIRTQLKIEYGEKTKERLILATDKNCHEDSIMAYVVFRSQRKKK